MTARRPQIAPWVNLEQQGWLMAGPELPYEMRARQTNPDLRIGDAERDRAIAELGDHYAAGRLTREEFDERSDQAMQARRHAELAPLFADLPVRPAEPPVRSASGTGFDPRWPLFWLAPLLLIAAVLMAVVASAPWVIWMVLTVFLVTMPWRRRGFGSHHLRHPMVRP